MNDHIVFNYVKFAKAVYDWNAACKGKVSSYSMDDFKLQSDICLEEIKETFDALKDRNLKEIVDGVCDVVVTCSYLSHMNQTINPMMYVSVPTRNVPIEGTINDPISGFVYIDPSKIKEDSISAIDMVNYSLSAIRLVVQNFVCSHGAITPFINYVAIYLQKEFYPNADIGFVINLLEECMQEVIDSNNSKLITEEQLTEHGVEVKFLEEARKKYDGQHENIEMTTSSLNGQLVYILRANHGNGKILKPFTFKEPVFNL